KALFCSDLKLDGRVVTIVQMILRKIRLVFLELHVYTHEAVASILGCVSLFHGLIRSDDAAVEDDLIFPVYFQGLLLETRIRKYRDGGRSIGNRPAYRGLISVKQFIEVVHVIDAFNL